LSVTATPPSSARPQPARAGRAARWATILLLAALTLRTYTDENTQPRLASYIVLMAVYLALFAAAGWRPRFPRWLLHAYLAAQCFVVVAMFVRNTEVDSVTAFLVPLSFQAALFFTGRELSLWVGILSLAAAGPLAAFRGVAEGLALAMSPMAFIIAIPAFAVLNQETEASRARSQAMVAGLQQTRDQLQQYAGQVEELASLQERSRLARELHDTVSQMIFTIVLTARSAQILLQQDTSRVRAELERLREISGAALGHLRSLITQLRP